MEERRDGRGASEEECVSVREETVIRRYHLNEFDTYYFLLPFARSISESYSIFKMILYSFD